MSSASFEARAQATPPALRWAGWIATIIVVPFLAFDGIIKLIAAAPAIQGTLELGFSASQVQPIGIIELVCFALYLIPRTAPIGAVLLTGYLGGAVAIHVRAANPLFTHILSPIYAAVLLWGALYARDPRVRMLIRK